MNQSQYEAREVPILRADNINFRYTGKSGKTVLKNLNLAFERGRFYAVMGPSGSGKTTLLSLLAGLDVPTAGQVVFRGMPVEPNQLAAYRRQVALVFQNFNLIDYLTPRENVLLGGSCDPTALLSQVGIDEHDYDRSVLKLSGGQQQRVAIARALARRAEVLLADEPTGNLDEATADGIIALLARYAHEEDACVVAVTHSSQLAARADVVIDLGSANSEQKTVDRIPCAPFSE